MIKVYRALLTQAGGSAPVATVLQNTLGSTPVWSYISTGSYGLTLAGAFPVGKTLVRISPVANSYLSGGPQPTLNISLDQAPDGLTLSVASEGASANDGLGDTPIEIIVYP